MKPCKHLDFTEGKFTDCVIRSCAPHYPNIQYWERGETWRSQEEEIPSNPTKVQFCAAGRGRINGIFQCYNGEMPCYDPIDPDAEQGGGQ